MFTIYITKISYPPHITFLYRFGRGASASKPRSYEGCCVSTFTCSLIWHLVESFMCSGPRENGHNVRKLSEKFANISIPQSASPQNTRNASHTHYCVFSLMVSLTFLYLNHYRHPSTLSIEYEHEDTCLKHFQILIQSKQQCLRMTAAVAGERSPICG